MKDITNKKLLTIYYSGFSLLYFLLSSLLVKLVCEKLLQIEVFSTGGFFISAWYAIWFTCYLIVATHFYVSAKFNYIDDYSFKLIKMVVLIQILPPFYIYYLIVNRQFTSNILIRLDDLIN